MKRNKLTKTELRSAINFYAYISPWLIGFIVLTAYPMVASLYLSFTNSDMGEKADFIGLQNFIHAFTEDQQFLISFKNTLVYVLLFVPSSLIISFLIGWLLSRNIKGLGFFRTVFY